VRVLVVDDEIASAETLKALLETQGFEVLTAHDGLAALDAAEAFLPEVVLLDIGLPGMNGFEVAQHLRTQPHLRDALLVALTGYGDAQTRMRAAQVGFDAHMTKPADLDRLLALLTHPRGARPSGH
jgi:CheY-like chemotaxis protein